MKVIVFLWRWSARNKANEGEWMQSAAEIVSSVSYFLMEFEKLENNNKDANSCVKHRWRPPPQEYYKINIDGVFDSKWGTGGWGFVVRNMKGEVMLSCACNICHVVSPIHAEARALRSVQHAAHRVCSVLFWRPMRQCSQLLSIQLMSTEVLLAV